MIKLIIAVTADKIIAIDATAIGKVNEVEPLAKILSIQICRQ